MAETATEEKAVELEGSASEAAASEAARDGAPEATAPEAAAPEAVAPEAAAPVGDGEGEAALGVAADGSGGVSQAARPRRGLEFLGGIELEAVVELGRARLTIGEVLELGPGSVVQLDTMLGDPAEMMIKDRLIARGEVVVVDDKFGLRVTEIVSREAE